MISSYTSHATRTSHTAPQSHSPDHSCARHDLSPRQYIFHCGVTFQLPRTSLHHNLRRSAANILLEPCSENQYGFCRGSRYPAGSKSRWSLPAHDMARVSSNCDVVVVLFLILGYQGSKESVDRESNRITEHKRVSNGVKLQGDSLAVQVQGSLPYGCGGARAPLSQRAPDAATSLGLNSCVTSHFYSTLGILHQVWISVFVKRRFQFL